MVIDFFKKHNINLQSLEDIDEQENPIASCKFVKDEWCWYVIGGEVMGDDYNLFGLVNGFVKELGFFTLKQIIDNGAILDETYTPIGVYSIYPDFDLRK